MSTLNDVSSFFATRPVLTASVITACAAALGLFLFARRRRSGRRNVAIVTGLFIYPVKSCRGISVTKAECQAWGFRHDRRWVIVNTASKIAPSRTVGQFVTQRQRPKLAQIEPAVDIDQRDGTVVLRLNSPGMDELVVRAPDSASAARGKVQVWRNEGDAVDCGDEAAAWLTKFTESTPGLRLFYMPEDSHPRNLVDDTKWGNLPTVTRDSQVAYADFSPYLLANEKSLAELNSRLSENAVSIRCFRPNIVVDSYGGGGAFCEDGWTDFDIGGVPFRFLKKCERCTMPLLDPDTGRKNGDEPLSTLKKYRLETSDERYGTSPCFGVNLASLEEGMISVGDEVSLPSLWW